MPREAVARMGPAMAHRGPDDEACFVQNGLALIQRRLILHGNPKRGALPVSPRGTTVLFDGRLDNVADLCRAADVPPGGEDAQVLPALWDAFQEPMVEKLRGAFALAAWDPVSRQLFLARDRFGICPLHWTQQGDWFLFASEIKTLLASGMVDARADIRGIHHLFTFFGVPGPVTCFEGVSALSPGKSLCVTIQAGSPSHRLVEKTYWELDFPNPGGADDGGAEDSVDEDLLVEEYEQLLTRSLQRRMCADVDVVAYSSGGLDSSLLVAMASKLRGQPLDTFTFAIQHPHLEESKAADCVADHVGNKPTVVECQEQDLVQAFPALVQAAESPVIDASAAALFLLAQALGRQGHRVVLTGEGADEWQAGYPWFRIDRRLDLLDAVPGVRLRQLGFRGYVHLFHALGFPWKIARGEYRAAGGHNAWMLAYVLMNAAANRFFSGSMRERLSGHAAFSDLGINHHRVQRWHPLNRSIYVGARIHLAGLHLNARGDRSQMHASLKGRYPFLDEDLVAFLARLHPRFKLRGLTDKYLQRKLALRWLPDDLVAGKKRLLHAPLDAFHRAQPPRFVEQLLSPESLRKTGYFDPHPVAYWRQRAPRLRHGFRRLFIEMALAGVISTQIWHHLFLDGSLADLPSMAEPTRAVHV